MSRLGAIKKTWAMCRRLARQRGGSRAVYFADALYCSAKHGASPENYFVLRFYDMDNRQRRNFLTSGRSKAADALLNAGATADDKRIVGRKEVFNRTFSGMVRRDFLYCPESSREEFELFVKKHPDFFAKPPAGTMGRGIEKMRVERDVRQLYESCRERGLLLEEIIQQHPELDKINPACVNTVRINAARGLDGRVRLIGACLKCGGPGGVTDNFHSGGVAYPLDIETGRVTGPGRNNRDTEDFFSHPGTDFYMPGFRLPYWSEVRDWVFKAMDKVPSLGYVGWDIAIRPDGPELIEGNYSWPGGNIIQFDNVGKYPLILECLDGGDGQHTVG